MGYKCSKAKEFAKYFAGGGEIGGAITGGATQDETVQAGGGSGGNNDANLPGNTQVSSDTPSVTDSSSNSTTGNSTNSTSDYYSGKSSGSSDSASASGSGTSSSTPQASSTPQMAASSSGAQASSAPAPAASPAPTPAPYNASTSNWAASQAPSYLRLSPAMTDLQVRSAIAGRAASDSDSMWRDPETQKYYQSILLHGLESGGMNQGLNDFLLPSELGYLKDNQFDVLNDPAHQNSSWLWQWLKGRDFAAQLHPRDTDGPKVAPAPGAIETPWGVSKTTPLDDPPPPPPPPPPAPPEGLSNVNMDPNSPSYQKDLQKTQTDAFGMPVANLLNDPNGGHGGAAISASNPALYGAQSGLASGLHAPGEPVAPGTTSAENFGAGVRAAAGGGIDVMNRGHQEFEPQPMAPPTPPPQQQQPQPPQGAPGQPQQQFTPLNGNAESQAQQRLQEYMQQYNYQPQPWWEPPPPPPPQQYQPPPQQQYQPPPQQQQQQAPPPPPPAPKPQAKSYQGDFNLDGVADTATTQDNGDGTQSIMWNGKATNTIGKEWNILGTGAFISGAGDALMSKTNPDGSKTFMIEGVGHPGAGVSIGNVGGEWNFNDIQDRNQDGSSDMTLVKQNADGTHTYLTYNIVNGQVVGTNQFNYH